LRSGRLETHFLIGVPKEEELKKIIHIYVDKFTEPIVPNKEEIEKEIFNEVKEKKFTGADFARMFYIIESTKEKIKEQEYN
jgi:SpoVK/Ycf46/Vps4 family AAA+-type ATPase